MEAVKENQVKTGPKLLSELYETHFRKLYHYAYQCLRERESAEDAVQTTFLIAQQKITEVQESPNQIGWLYRTLQNIIRNKRREYIRWQRLLARITVETAVSVEAPPDDSVVELLGVIKPEDFRLLTMFYLEGYSQWELCEEFGISLSACKMRILRAKETFLEKLGGE